ncbi:MAG TPA: GAF domain-containing protein [Patescibacteria group bacterium]|nr:GAF domain-containing protein [Patescibacteria group bacterium]
MKLLRVKKKECDRRSEKNGQSGKNRLYTLTWRNWFFLTGVLVLTTLGLGTALPPLISERIVHPWPWIKTDLILIVGLSVTVFAVVLYLTQQQRHVLDVNRRMQHLVKESDKRMHGYIGRLYALIRLGRTLAEETDLPTVFNCITNMCVEVFNCQRASLMLYEPEMKELVLRAVSGLPAEAIIDSRLPLGEGIAGWAAQRGEALLLGNDDDSERYPELDLHDETIASAMVVPIMLRSELVGVINVSSTSPETLYDKEDLGALQVFAENTGAYIRHAEQAHWMRQTIKTLQQSRSKENRQEERDDDVKLQYAQKRGRRGDVI